MHLKARMMMVMLLIMININTTMVSVITIATPLHSKRIHLLSSMIYPQAWLNHQHHQHYPHHLATTSRVSGNEGSRRTINLPSSYPRQSSGILVTASRQDDISSTIPARVGPDAWVSIAFDHTLWISPTSVLIEGDDLLLTGRRNIGQVKRI